MAPLRITGEQTPPGSSARSRVEVEVHGGTRRLAFAQAAFGAHSVLAALTVDGLPRVLTLHGAHRGALVVGPAAAGLPMLTGHAALDDTSIAALEPVLGLFADGLYTITTGACVPAEAPPDFVEGGGRFTLPGAPVGGVPVAVLLEHTSLVLSGVYAARAGAPAVLVAADVILDAPGFVAHAHDRGAREAFSRAPGHVLDGRLLRDAVASHCARHPDAELGPLALAELEPAAGDARALLLALALEDIVEGVGDLVRLEGARTDFQTVVRARALAFEVALVSADGQRIDEVVIRLQGRLRASGVRPAARAIARALRQLADEGV